MTTQELIIETQELMSESEFINSIDLLLEHVEEDELKNELILLKSKLNKLRKKHRIGLITSEHLEVGETNVAQAILLIVNELDDVKPNEKPIQNDERVVLETILTNLSMTYQAYKNIRLARERLADKLENRLDDLPYDNYIDLFSGCYPKMTKEELRDHKIMRNFTKNIVQPHNQKVLQLLQAHPNLKTKIKDLAILEIHLVLWRSKYDSIFIHDESICTIYILEKSSRFPKNIENDIRHYLAQQV